ncbi:MAG: rhomboid family intramembrane serine protease [Chitinophagaceae bacterium]
MTFEEKQYKQKIAQGEKTSPLMMLVALSLILFVILAFVKALWYFNYQDKQVALPLFNKNVLGLFVLSADLNTFLSKPWTILTQMFAHDNIWKIFSNMLWLWCFGYIMQDLTGNKKIIPVFIYGAFGGAIAFLLAYNLLPSLSQLQPYATTSGAAAGVMAVAVATTMVSPGYRIFPLLKGGLPLWVLTGVYMISDFATVSIGDTGTLITHLAGAFTGFLFIFFFNRGYDWSEWMNNLYDWFNNLFNPDKPLKGKKLKEELFYKSSGDPYKKTPNVTPQRIDEILDKINQVGFNQLTEEEKEFLKRAAE